jgi:hypothetical protein
LIINRESREKKFRAEAGESKMKTVGPIAIQHQFEIQSSSVNTLFFATLAIIMMLTVPAPADPETMPVDKRITIKKVFPDADNGFVYALGYYVAAPIEAVWHFKTDFKKWHPNTGANAWLHWELDREGAYNEQTG